MDTSGPEFQEALRDHARSLGVDPDAESFLLPLVQEALLAELPPDWEQGETEDGTLYYFNSSTEESIWEHPLDAHYRELIQTKKEEHAAQPTPVQAPTDTNTGSSAPAATNNVDVYSFDDVSDEETPTPVTSLMPASKSRISDLFTTPTVSIPLKKPDNTSTPVVPEKLQTTPAVATGFGFGRDRSWLLDNDDDVAPIPIKPTPLSTSLQKQDAIDTGPSRLGAFSSRRSGASATDPVTPLTSIQTPTEETPKRSTSLASTVKGPFYQDAPIQPTGPVPASAPSPTTIAKIQKLEKSLADANSDLARERTAHSETTKQLQAAQQEAKESNYLKMKVNELKSKLTEQESASVAREKQHTDKLTKLEAENARLIKQQSQTQSQQMETQQKEAQQNREALESKQAELERLQKQLLDQEQQAKVALEAHEKAQAEVQQKLIQQQASAEASSHQHASEVASLRKQLETLEQQHRSLKVTAEEQAEKSEQLDKVQQELRTLKSVAGDQAAKCEELEKLQQELRTLKNTASEQAAKCEQLEQLQLELRTLKSTADEQASKCDQLKTVQESLSKHERLVQELEEKNRGLQAQIDRLQRENSESNRKHDTLTQDLETKKADLSTLQNAFNRTQDEQYKAQEELRKAQDELRASKSSLDQQRHQQQLTLERERATADAETQAQSRIQRLQTQLNAQLDEQTAAKTRLQSEVIELKGELASVQAQQVKPLEKLRDQLQRDVDRLTERVAILEKELRTAKLELSGQTDRANQLEIEVDVLVRREQQRKSQMDALTTTKNTAEKQLATLQDELLTAQHDKRVDTDKLSFRVRELESQVTQKEYESARLEERFAKAEAWRAKEAARVEKRDSQLMELREQLTALQGRHVEMETSAEIQELRASKQQTELKMSKLERELSDERDARKRDEIRRTEELQRMQQAVEWQLPQLAQACVARSSDEWTRKCRAVAKKLRDELSMRALQERNEVVARQQQAQEACDRAEQKLKTAVAESEFLKREVNRLEDNNKVLLEQLHTIRVYLTQRQMPSQVTGINSPPWASPPVPPVPPTAPSAPVPLNFSDFSTVNQLNTQLGILHAQFQQLFDSNDSRRSTSFSPSDRFEIPGSPMSRTPGTPKPLFSKENQRREAEAKEEEDVEIQRLAMDALMDQKINSIGNTPSTLQRQQEELLTTLESLGEGPNQRWLPVYPSGQGPLVSVDEEGGEHEPHSTLWYQQDYWRRKYQ
ncbi:Centrosomal protein [Phytophthora citrophthora]|uniref:Centrosomal protein n=1 Tax=Phytophthora citrophthora TaxID=4793 RepID=A0AAD9G3M2_9STRA|nr:Centrosomal protein [Phytophthora citrophthora]